jgi:phosphate starvation-inducible membrane PsiE
MNEPDYFLYFIYFISFVALIGAYFINKMDFNKPKLAK